MDIQKVATYGSAAAVVGTGTIIGGGTAIDHATGGPEKRVAKETTELRMIVREEVRSAIQDMMPKSTGGVLRMSSPNKDYRKEVLKEAK